MNTLRLELSEFGAMYLAALLVMAVLDAAWLGWLARDFYKQEMGALMLASPRLVPAALFYLLYPLGLVYLALWSPPSGWPEAVLRSFVVGLVAYGVYDLTNLATLRGWSVRMSLVDMLWGAFASGVAGAAAYAVLLRMR